MTELLNSSRFWFLYLRKDLCSICSQEKGTSQDKKKNKEKRKKSLRGKKHLREEKNRPRLEIKLYNSRTLYIKAATRSLKLVLTFVKKELCSFHYGVKKYRSETSNREAGKYDLRAIAFKLN